MEKSAKWRANNPEAWKKIRQRYYQANRAEIIFQQRVRNAGLKITLAQARAMGVSNESERIRAMESAREGARLHSLRPIVRAEARPGLASVPGRGSGRVPSNNPRAGRNIRT